MRDIPQKIQDKILNFCRSWADWYKLGEDEKEETIAELEEIYLAGFDHGAEKRWGPGNGKS